MMLLAQALQGLVDMDTDLLLLINGMHNAFFDSFMSAYSGKLVWVPLYASILYVIFRNFSWRVALLCVVAVALTITFADQVCSSAIRPAVERLRPSRTPELDGLVHIVNGYRGGRYGFPSCHAANTFGLGMLLGPTAAQALAHGLHGVLGVAHLLLTRIPGRTLSRRLAGGCAGRLGGSFSDV